MNGTEERTRRDRDQHGTDQPETKQTGTKRPWATYLWPGLDQLWIRGSWSALAVAMLASGLLSAAVLGSIVWSELFARDVLAGLWLAVGLLWLGGIAYSGFAPARPPAEPDEPPRTTDHFPLAIQHYLKGNWFESERLLTAALRRNVRDIESRLMLVTLLRRRQRLDEAEGQLDTLERFDGAERWLPEINRERQLIIEADEALARAEAGEQDNQDEIDELPSAA
jgi:hypothetical protein